MNAVFRMPIQSSLRVLALFLITLTMAAPCTAALPSNPLTEAQTESKMTQQDIERVMSTLQDPQKREELIKNLQAMSAATAQQEQQDQGEDVRSAAAQMIEMLADKASEASQAAVHLLDSLNRLPELAQQWQTQLHSAEQREYWLSIAWRLLLVLAAGFAAASFLNLLIQRIQASKNRQLDESISIVQRVGILSVRLLMDMTPIVLLTLVSYAVLAVVDPRHQTRLVAVALINASVLSRLVLAVARFLLSPQTSRLRLWSIEDESANYIYQWTKRISQIAIYGFYGLQAALLLGLQDHFYESLLKILGAVILLLLLVLIAQNRQEVANKIAPPPSDAETQSNSPSTSMRRGLARVWHLLTGFYLLVMYSIWTLRIEDGAIVLLRATVVSFAALAIGRLLSHAIDQVFERGLSLSDDLRTQYPSLEKRLNRYFPVLRGLAKAVLWLVVTLTIGYAIGLDTLHWVTEGSGKVFISAALHILLVLAVAFFFWEFASGAIESYLSETDSYGRSRVRTARIKTLLTVARNALLVVVSVITLLMVLSELGLNIAPLLAGAGVLGLAIGFGSQRLVQDVINGAFILFQDLMSVGDVVKLGDKAGVVEALSIRTVRLRDLGGVVHTIPFGSIDAVSNLTREFSFHVFDIGIAYREDVDQVIALIKQVGDELQQDPDIGPLILEPLEMFGLDQFGDSAIVIKGRIKTRPIKQWAVGRAFNRLLKRRFDEQGVEIPFPHRTLYFGQDKDGSAPPAFVHMERLINESQSKPELRASAEAPPPGETPDP